MPITLLLSTLPWRWIGASLLAILAALVFAEIKHIGRLERDLDAATEIANANAAIADQERQAQERADQTAAAMAIAAERARQRFATQRRKVTDAPPQADGPLAPVLRSVLDSLPEPATPPEADRDGPRHTSVPARVSGRASASGG